MNAHEALFFNEALFNASFWPLIVTNPEVTTIFKTFSPLEIGLCSDRKRLLNFYMFVTCPVIVSCTRVERMVRWVLATAVWKRLCALPVESSS